MELFETYMKMTYFSGKWPEKDWYAVKPTNLPL